MPSTAIDRRTVLRLIGGGLLWPLLPPWVRAQPPRRLYLSARADADGGFRVSGFTDNGRPAFDLPLPARGHSFAIRRDGATAVHFARRPGDFAAVIDLASGAKVREITTPDDRHFYGHGAFTADGRLLEKQRLGSELHQLSIRHLAIGRDDTVAVAMQYEGPTGDRVPLVARHRRGEPLQTLDGPADVVRAMKHYAGSAAVDAAGRIVAISAPRDNIVTFWDLTTGRYLSHVDVDDGCGVAPGTRPGEFLASSGRGGVVAVHARSATVTPLVSNFLDAAYWDNHLIVYAT